MLEIAYLLNTVFVAQCLYTVQFNPIASDLSVSKVVAFWFWARCFTLTAFPGLNFWLWFGGGKGLVGEFKIPVGLAFKNWH